MKLNAIGMTWMKGTRLRSLTHTVITSAGIAGDRSFILLDGDGVPITSSKHAVYLPLMIDVSDDGRRMTMTCPDGTTFRDALHFGPEETLDYMGMRQVSVLPVMGDWNRRLSEFAERPTRIVKAKHAGGGVDVKPITLVTTASLDALSEKIGRPVDPRRFRANLILSGGPAHIEDSWDGKRLKVGDAILRVRSSVPRCIVTQLDPDTGRNDMRTVPVLMGYRDKVHLPDGLMPDYATPGFCSFAEVETPGQVGLGDPVTLV